MADEFTMNVPRDRWLKERSHIIDWLNSRGLRLAANKFDGSAHQLTLSGQCDPDLQPNLALSHYTIPSELDSNAVQLAEIGASIAEFKHGSGEVENCGSASAIKDQVAEALPDFPSDVIDQWIGYYAESEGWPPPDPLSGRWKGLLGGHSLDFWKALSWSCEHLAPTQMTLVPDCTELMNQMIGALTRGEKNAYSEYMGKEGKDKFHQLLWYIIQNGEPPKAGILISHADGYEVIDGNHRIVAYLVWSECRDNSEFIEKLECDPVPLLEKIPFWVGRYA